MERLLRYDPAIPSYEACSMSASNSLLESSRPIPLDSEYSASLPNKRQASSSVLWHFPPLPAICTRQGHGISTQSSVAAAMAR